VNAFITSVSEVTLPAHKAFGEAQTKATNDAIDNLIEFYKGMESTSSAFEDVDIAKWSGSLENDLRIWWGEYPKEEDDVDEMDTGDIECTPEFGIDANGQFYEIPCEED
jgi:hypothetical protein